MSQCHSDIAPSSSLKTAAFSKLRVSPEELAMIIHALVSDYCNSLNKEHVVTLSENGAV